MNVCLNVKLICNVLVVAITIIVNLMLPDGSEEASDKEHHVPSTSTANSRTRKPVWRTRQQSDMASTEPVFRGETFAGNPVSEPIVYFNDHLDDEMKANFVAQSNLFAIQTTPNKPLGITVPELDQFIALHDIVCMPRADMYWSVEMRYGKVADVMPIARFKTIKRMLHVNDNTSRPDNCQDRLYKIRPFIDAVGEKA